MNKSVVRYILSSIILSYCSFSAVAQLHKIYSEDTIYTQSFFRRENAADSFNYYYSFPLKDLKNKLPDGTWIFYNVPKKDSNWKDKNSCIEIEGHYKNGLRNGVFNYYTSNNFIKKPLVRIYRYNYKNGKLDGYFTGWYNTMSKKELKEEEGFYSNGKKNGFFTHFDKDGMLDEMNLYRNDTLCEWAEYFNDKLLHSGIGKLGYGQWSLWDTAGRVLYWGGFRNDSLMGYKQYKNAQLIKSGVGKFRDYHSKYMYNFMDDTIPMNGTVKYFNSDGALKKEETYKDGKLIVK